MKFLKDSYNGIFVVLLKPYMPKWKTLAILIGGVLLGLIWSYALSPTIYYDADPRALHQSWQDEWVKLLADRYAQETNANISANITNLLSRVDDPLDIVDRLISQPGEEVNRTKLEAIRPFAEQAQPVAVQPPQTNFIGNIIPFVLAPIVIAIVGTIVAILWGMFIYPNLIEPLLKRGQAPSAEVVQERKARVEAARLMDTKKTDFVATSNYGPPLMQKMSTYTPGFGTYDESYTIEDEQERFLGECGALVSESIGTGDPAKAAAIEVWLFDKDDFVRTVTKVFASEYAFNDPALRSKLEAKGDLVLATPGATVMMETSALRLQARIVDMQYGTGPLPPNSYFDKMTVELAAWRKESAAAPATIAEQPISVVTQTIAAPQPPQSAPPASFPTRQPPVPQQPTYTPPAQPVPSQPPPTQPSFQPLPAAEEPYVPPAPQRPPSASPGTLGGGSAPSLRPASAPPPPAPDPDDDPFGGTGDFKPIT
jgi:hypothetical protein